MDFVAEVQEAIRPVLNAYMKVNTNFIYHDSPPFAHMSN
jgi:hypothetical protein